MNYKEFFDSLNGKNVAVMGFGVSNRPLTALLLEANARVTVYDKKDAETLGNEALRLKRLGVTFVTGDGYLSSADGDYIFRSPSIHPKFFRNKKGILTSEMELFFELARCKIIGVTGSDGKTTTTTLIAKMLEASGKKVHLGGNIGKPLLAEIPSMKTDDIAVVELSSFQLMTMNLSPDIAVITNVSPNHLDIHSDMDEYINAKKNIFTHQKPGSRLVLNLDNEITRGFSPNRGVSLCGFTLKNTKAGCERVSYHDNGIYHGKELLLQDSDILIPGKHNIDNYMAAISAVIDMAGKEQIKKVASTFGGVEHRLELVRLLNGVRYYNSSIDSSPTRTAAALSVFNTPVIVIMGGYDKNLAFEPLKAPVHEHCAAVVLLGATSDKIEKVIAGDVKTIRVSSMEEAVNTAKAEAENTGSRFVVLSPACASFDMFPNFMIRGECFKKEVNAL